MGKGRRYKYNRRRMVKNMEISMDITEMEGIWVEEFDKIFYHTFSKGTP